MTASIVLAVRETQYIEPLLHYVHHSEYGELLSIKAFSRMDAFTEYLKSGESPDAVVGDPSFIEAWLVEGRSAVPWAVLEEGGGTGIRGRLGPGGTVIAKYQALPALLTSILQLCEVRRTRQSSGTGKGPLLIGVVAGSGSSGRTTVALNMAKQFGSQGLSVFYLNLETVDSSGMFLRPPGGNGPGLEMLLYELQAARDKENAPDIRIGSYAVRLDALHSDAFRPVSNVKEMVQMGADDARELLERLAADGGYDVIIADTGNLGEARASAVLQHCSRLVWVVRDDEVGVYKAGRWLSHLISPNSGSAGERIGDLMAKSLFAVNFVKDGVQQILFPDGLQPDAVLPYISSWNLPYRGELSLNSPLFQQGIRRLCELITGTPETGYPQLEGMP